jgi:hypothetical protein
LIGRCDVEDVDGDVVGALENWNIMMNSGWELDVGCVEFEFVWSVVRCAIRIARTGMNVSKDGPEETEVVGVLNVYGGFSGFDVGR